MPPLPACADKQPRSLDSDRMAQWLGLERDTAQIGEFSDALIFAEVVAHPLFLTPPKGIWVSSCTVGPLMWHIPDSIRSATDQARATSRRKTADDRRCPR